MNGYSGACGVATCLLAELMLSRFHTVTLTTLAPYASTLPQIILVLHTSFLACLASPSLSSLDVQIVVLDFKPLMFHELLHVVMVGVLTLLHGFKGSYFKSTVYHKDTEATLCGVDDMTKLAYLHEPSVLDYLRSRLCPFNYLTLDLFSGPGILFWYAIHYSELGFEARQADKHNEERKTISLTTKSSEFLSSDVILGKYRPKFHLQHRKYSLEQGSSKKLFSRMGSNFMKLWWKELDLQKLVDQKNPED
ncbi:hypothetical protein JHK84_040586 [Glycine max]|nr:hypothetical protein JHK84_040586 [Glycine max]